MAINSLPDELIHKIMCCVSANSFTDLFNAKLACQRFQTFSETGSVYKAVELSQFRNYMHDGKKARFLDNSVTNNNPEVFYNTGVRYYFQQNLTNEGLQLLKSAADGGFDRAVYVYALLQQTLGEDEEAKNYFSRLTRDVAMEVRSQLSQERGIVWECMLPEAFVEKRRQFDPTALVSGCYCDSLNLQRSNLLTSSAGDNLLCDRCFMHLEHSWFLQYFVAHLTYWTVHPYWMVDPPDVENPSTLIV